MKTERIRKPEADSVQKTASAVLSGFAFLLPLAFCWKLYDTFDLAKVTVFHAGALAAALLAVVRIYSNGFSLKKASLDMPFLVFVAVYGVSALFSMDPSMSFWGQYRSYVFGWLALAVCAVLYRSVAELGGKGLEEKVLSAVVFGGALAGVYGILQYFGWEFSFMPLNTGSAPWASFGNPIYFGANCMMVLAPAVALYELHREKKESKAMSVLLASAVLALLIGLVLSRSRGAWGGAIVGLAVYFGVRGRSSRNLAFLIMGVGLTAVLASPVSRNRVISIFQPQGADFARFEGWKLALKVFVQNPVLGTGPDTFVYAFRKIRNMEYVHATGAQVVHAQAHNDALQYAATSGIPGLCAYLWLWISVFRLGWKRKDSLLGLSMLASLAALFIQNAFNFWSPATLWLFGLFCGLLASEKNQEKIRSVGAGVWIGAGLLWVMGMSGVLVPAWADSRFMKALPYEASQDYESGIREIRAAITSNPRVPEYYQRLSNLFRNQAHLVGIPEVRDLLLQRALSVAQEAAGRRR
jgi:putative inorganic carbon (HCO3(-)) transporter